MTEILIQVEPQAEQAFRDLLHLKPVFKQYLAGDERDELEQKVCDLTVTLLQGVLATTSPYRKKITAGQELHYALVRFAQETNADNAIDILLTQLDFFQEPTVKETLCFSSSSPSLSV